MNTLTSLIFSRTSGAIALYLLVILSLGFLAQSQINSMRLLPSSHQALDAPLLPPNIRICIQKFLVIMINYVGIFLKTGLISLFLVGEVSPTPKNKVEPGRRDNFELTRKKVYHIEVRSCVGLSLILLRPIPIRTLHCEALTLLFANIRTYYPYITG